MLNTRVTEVSWEREFWGRFFIPPRGVWHTIICVNPSRFFTF